jgi:hypothetical protein
MIRGHWSPLHGIVALACVVLVAASVRAPRYNWDMIGYVASARVLAGADERQLQREIYDLLRDSVPEETYAELTTGHGRHVRATDPGSLSQHLLFYRGRLAYVGAIRALDGLGMNPFLASHLVSAVCAALAVWVLAFLPPGPPRAAYVLGVLAIVWWMGFLRLAGTSTPDAMSALAIIVCYRLLLRRRRVLLAVLPLCVLVRTDLLILAGLFAAYLWFARGWNRGLVAASLVAAVALYLGVQAWSGHYGWATVFDYTFRHRSTHPADYPHAVTLQSYLEVLGGRMVRLLVEPRFLVSTAAVLAGLAVVRRCDAPVAGPPTVDRHDALFALASTLAYTGLHFLVFPVIWTRFHAGPYALGLALALWVVLDRVGSPRWRPWRRPEAG